MEQFSKIKIFFIFLTVMLLHVKPRMNINKMLVWWDSGHLHLILPLPQTNSNYKHCKVLPGKAPLIKVLHHCCELKATDMIPEKCKHRVPYKPTIALQAI